MYRWYVSDLYRGGDLSYPRLRCAIETAIRCSGTIIRMNDTIWKWEYAIGLGGGSRWPFRLSKTRNARTGPFENIEQGDDYAL